MFIRTRVTGIQCTALLFGAVLGLFTSFRDVGNVYSTKVMVKPVQRNFSKFLSMYEQLGKHKSGNDIIESKGSRVAPKYQAKTKSIPFVFNTSAFIGPVVNPHPFEYTIEPVQACKSKDLFLVAYVHTAPDHYERRDQVRKTWGNTSLYKDIKMEVYFMVGLAANSEMQEKIVREADEHEDIVQESYVDAYHNLSYKAIGAMRWVSTRCKHTKFILKTDDDVFINTFALIKHLRDLDRAQVHNTGLLMCLVWYKMHVLREGKWKVDEEVIPDEFYPHYCSGMGYIMSPDIAEAIYKTSAYVPFFWVDDVYITGMIPKRMNLTHVDIVKLFMGRKEVEWLLSGKDWHKYLFCHLRDQTFYFKMWKKLEDRGLHEEIPDMKDIIAGKIAVDYGPKKPPDSGTNLKPGPKVFDRKEMAMKHLKRKLSS